MVRLASRIPEIDRLVELAKQSQFAPEYVKRITPQDIKQLDECHIDGVATILEILSSAEIEVKANLPKGVAGTLARVFKGDEVKTLEEYAQLTTFLLDSVDEYVRNNCGCNPSTSQK